MSQEQINFIFRCQPKKSSKYGVLVNYINNEEEMAKNELILTSLASLWLPFAYNSCPGISEKELKKHALFAIHKLKLHIQFLEDTFDLDTHTYLPLAKTEHEKSISNGWHQSKNIESFEDLHDEFTDFQDEDDILNSL